MGDGKHARSVKFDPTSILLWAKQQNLITDITPSECEKPVVSVKLDWKTGKECEIQLQQGVRSTMGQIDKNQFGAEK